jgi:hypothetical protein
VAGRVAGVRLVKGESRWACAKVEWVALVGVTAVDEVQMGWVYYVVRSVGGR